jgi:hypothetical protein
MIKQGIDWRSLVIGLLLGICTILMAAQYQKTSGQNCQYQIVTSKSTWVIDTSTGDVWQIYGLYDENDTCSFKWYYAGNPSSKGSHAKDSYTKSSYN